MSEGADRISVIVGVGEVNDRPDPYVTPSPRAALALP